MPSVVTDPIFQRKEAAFLEEKICKFLNDKKGITILLSGERGGGKARLVMEALKIKPLRLSLHQDENFVHSVISAASDVDELFYGEEFSFSIWKNLIKDIELSLCANLVNRENGFTKNQYVELVKKVVSDIGMDWLKLVPYLGDISLTGIKTIKSVYSGYKDEKKNLKQESQTKIPPNQEEVFNQITAYLVKVTEQIPGILFINNIQWADNSSLLLLSSLCRYIKEHSPRLLLILTYSDREIFGNKILIKNDFKSIYTHLTRNNLFEEIEVSNLNISEIKEYIKSRDIQYDFDENFYKKIFELSKGNMFFINTILKNLSSGKMISNASLDSFSIPTSLSVIVDDYLDHISAEGRNILNSCSVMGETFSMEIIEKLFAHGENELENLIQELVENKLIISSKKKMGNLKKIYQFYQSLTCKYVYTNYDENLRLEKHAKIARLLKEKLNDTILDIYIYHFGIGNLIINEANEIIVTDEDLKNKETFDCSDEYLKEIINLSEKYQLQFLYNEALKFYSKVIFLSSLLENKETEIHFSIKKIRVLISLGIYEEAIVMIKRLYDNYDQLNDETKASLDMQRGELYERTDENTAALEYYQKAEVVYEKNNDTAGLALTYGNIGTIYYKKNDYETALTYYNKKLSICKELKMLLEEHRVYNDFANIHLNRSELDEAETIQKKNYEFYDKSGDVREKMITLGNLGIVYKEKKMFAEALKCQNEKLELALKLNDRREVMRTYANFGSMQTDTDDLTEALNSFNKALKIAVELDDTAVVAGATGMIGVIFAQQKKYDDAKKYLKSAMELCVKSENKKHLIVFLEEYINLLIELNDVSGINGYIKQGMEISNEISDKKNFEKFQNLLSEYHD